MSVYKHPSKDGWQMIKISHGREGKAEYIPFPGTKDEALAYEREIRGLNDQTDPGFLDHLPEFRLWYRNQVMVRTFEDFEGAFKRIEPYFADKKIRHITPMLVESYKGHRLQQRMSKRTITRELSYLSKYLGWQRDSHGLEAIKPKGLRFRP
jgi:hypothetical protein